MIYDLIIVGAGAAGLFTAANCKGKKVLLLEKMPRVGKKLLLSGSGQCNVTNKDSEEVFLSNFPKKQRNFLKPAIMDFTPDDAFIWFEKQGLPLFAREDGKVFPKSLKATDVVNTLRDRALENGVHLQTESDVRSITKENDLFTVKTNTREFKATNILLATGGLSVPGTGSDGFGYSLAKSMGHSMVETTQALAAVDIENYKLASLAGIAIRDAQVEFFHEGETKRYHTAVGDLLFTHQGLSGPVILNNSRQIQKRDTITVSLIKCSNREEKRTGLSGLFTKNEKKSIKNFIKECGIVERLTDVLLKELGLKGDEKIATLNKKIRRRIISLLIEYPFLISRKAGFNKAMTTAGGVSLKQVDRKTMMSKKVPGLYFAGEMLDIDGDTGGYNIHAAFAMGLRVVKSVTKID